jgi:thioredoxin 1
MNSVGTGRRGSPIGSAWVRIAEPMRLLLCVSCAVMALSSPAIAADEPQGPRDSSEQIVDRILKSPTPVLIDFWAVWCGPCRMLNPIIKELETEYKGKVLFIKINVDQHVMISRYFNVSAIPAIFVVKDKAVLYSLPGYRPKEDYRQVLNEVLAKPAKPAAPDSSGAKK